MVKDGDWLTPKSAPSESEPFFEKPPLKFWIVALPIKAGLLPANEFGMRFWDAVMGSVAFLYVFAIGRRLAGPICGFAASSFCSRTRPLVLAHGLRTNNMEAAVFLAYAAAIYHFMAWRTSGPDDRGHIFAMASFSSWGS
jgi:4-amino-4-deoxy-L-arabinose transferase-like glycosyltransferase